MRKKAIVQTKLKTERFDDVCAAIEGLILQTERVIAKKKNKWTQSLAAMHCGISVR
jgi:hypothetical protein